MTQHINLAGLALAQAIHQPPMEAITLRYDASRNAANEPVIYAYVTSMDICKLPTDVLSGLGVGADRVENNGDPVFFVGDDEELRLYVDTEVYPSFKADLQDIAEQHGIPLRDAHGDLRALTGSNGDVGLPDMPAFVHAGLERIDCASALATISIERDQMLYAIRKEPNDGPGLQ